MIKIWRETFIVKEPYKIMCKCGLNLLTLIYLNKFCSANLTQCTLSPSVPLAEKINVQIFLYPIQVTNIKFWFISPGPKKHILLVPILSYNEQWRTQGKSAPVLREYARAMGMQDKKLIPIRIHYTMNKKY